MSMPISEVFSPNDMSQMRPSGIRKNTVSQKVPGSARTQNTSRFSLQKVPGSARKNTSRFSLKLSRQFSPARLLYFYGRCGRTLASIMVARQTGHVRAVDAVGQQRHGGVGAALQPIAAGDVEGH
jgi:hypothetical protein